LRWTLFARRVVAALNSCRRARSEIGTGFPVVRVQNVLDGLGRSLVDEYDACTHDSALTTKAPARSSDLIFGLSAALGGKRSPEFVEMHLRVDHLAE